MSGKFQSSSRKKENRKSTVNSVPYEDDKRFLAFLNEYIDHEKQYMECPAEGPDELRYMVYRAAFNEVIGRVSACRRVLLLIKAEYDNTIQDLKRREDEARATRRRAAAAATHTHSLMICETRAAQLRHRISVLQTQTAELQESSRQKFCEDLSSWMLGLTEAGPEDLDRHLLDLQTRRAALLDRKSRSVPLEVQSRLEAELQEVQGRRDRLRGDNIQLRLLHERLKSVNDGFKRWTDEGQVLPLEKLLVSTMKSSELLHEADEDACSFAAELLEDREQSVDDYLLRFLQLFDSGRYKDAALHAARSPGGILRNLDVMEMFAGVRAPAGGVPPPLLFFQALLVTVAAGQRMPPPLSLQGVSCALKFSRLQLAVHAVTQNKVSFTEELGDRLSEHAQKDLGGADLCLALATIVYEACGLTRKTAVSMCRRGLVHGAAELMQQSPDLTAEDYMWVLCRSLSLPLLQVLSDHSRGCTAILSVGLACKALLADLTQQKQQQQQQKQQQKQQQLQQQKQQQQQQQQKQQQLQKQQQQQQQQQQKQQQLQKQQQQQQQQQQLQKQQQQLQQQKQQQQQQQQQQKQQQLQKQQQQQQQQQQLQKQQQQQQKQQQKQQLQQLQQQKQLQQQQQQLALQLLEGFLRGEVLQNVILKDSGSTVDIWDKVASLCSGLGRDDLSQAVRAILLDQDGTRDLIPDLKEPS